MMVFPDSTSCRNNICLCRRHNSNCSKRIWERSNDSKIGVDAANYPNLCGYRFIGNCNITKRPLSYLCADNDILAFNNMCTWAYLAL